MIIKQPAPLRVMDKVTCICDLCSKEFERRYRDLLNTRKNFNMDLCRSCVCKSTVNKKPQCSKEFWENQERKKSHSQSLKNSEKYKEAIKLRDQSGEKNGMYGKKCSEEFREAARNRRLGKKQSEETVRKRKETIRKKNENREYKISLNRRIKSYLHFTLDWYKKIFIRDNFKCVKCGSNEKLDAHHKEPISKIIKRLLEETNFENDNEKYEFLIKQTEILDENLNNGITLCRICHKKIHYKWGSHYAEIR